MSGTHSPARIHLQVLPDWTPSKNAAILRASVLVKVARGVVLEDPIAVQLFDKSGRHLGELKKAIAGEAVPLVGPAWSRLRGSLLSVPSEVEQLQASLPGIVSEKVYRRDARVPLLLVPIPFQIGIVREPHLWWRFYNHEERPIPTADILNQQTILLDGRTYHPVSGSYDGPAFLEPGRGFASFWSLDDIDSSARLGRHRLQLQLFGLSSNEVELEWQGASPPP